jgi:hypothetical protein
MAAFCRVVTCNLLDIDDVSQALTAFVITVVLLIVTVLQTRDNHFHSAAVKAKNLIKYFSQFFAYSRSLRSSRISLFQNFR